MVARIGEDTLGTERLAELLVLGQPLPLEETEARELVLYWVQIMELARRAAAGDSILDAAAVEAALRFERQEILFRRLQARAGIGSPLRGDEIDSVYDRGNLLLLGHLFRASPEDRSPEQRARQEEAAREMREVLIRTRSLDEANAMNQDPAARRNGGLLLVGPGELPPGLEAIARGLGPGQVSTVVPTELGFHVLVRPSLSDVRPLFARMVSERRAGEEEAALLQGLWESAGVRAIPTAAEAVRGAARDPAAALASERIVVRWGPGEGSEMTLGEVARTLFLLPPRDRAALVRARAGQIESYLRRVVVRRLAEEAAVGASLPVPDSVELRLAQELREVVDTLLAAADLGPRGSGAAGDEASVRARVGRHMEAAMARRQEVLEIPPLLAAHLLATSDWSLDPGHLELALDRAARLLELAGYQGPDTRPPDSGAARSPRDPGGKR
jgi:hypothetical protein